MWTQWLSSAQMEMQTVLQTAPAQHSGTQELVSLVFMPAEQLYTACSSHSSITADTAWQTSENAHANKPRIRVTRRKPCFLQLLGKVSSHSCKKTGRQLLPGTGLARCSFPVSLPLLAVSLDFWCFQFLCGRDCIALTIDWVMTKRCSCNWSNSRSPLTMLFTWIDTEA